MQPISSKQHNEISGAHPPTLMAAQDRFIAAWGQMGSTWGISRTMAEIHALLYISNRPMFTDEVMERLQISRGNASMSLRALVDWGVIARILKRGDRKEYFVAEHDVWALLRQVIRERLRREVHPVLAELYEIRDLTSFKAAEHAPSSSTHSLSADDLQLLEMHNSRLDSLLNMMRLIDTLGERFVGSEGQGLDAAASVLSSME